VDFDKRKIREPYHLLISPQFRFVYGVGNKQLVNLVGRYENLQEDWLKIREHLEAPTSEILPMTEKTEHGLYQRYYNKRTRQIVTDLFKDDIEAFGYEFHS